MSKSSAADNGFDRIAFKMHPRVFAALGADLVTNDVVAVIELVKNSYDAFASNVWIRFRSSPTRGDFLEITDDGQGMTREVIEDAWCVVATPFRKKNPYAERGGKQRRVAGEKGLGRLSMARLGDRARIVTQAPKAPCWEVQVNWSAISEEHDLSSCFVRCREFSNSPFAESGTSVRIYGLKGTWNEEQISDLEDNLARLISPFAEVGDFDIFLARPGAAKEGAVQISSPEFLSKPKYLITGDVSEKGEISATYKFKPIREGKPRTRSIELTRAQVNDAIKERSRNEPVRFTYDENETHCGPFTFRIRAWDIAPEDTQEIAEKFDLQKSKIRKAIRAHKGISVYRDGILVLPKTDSGRDWLGLDLRRISKVGTRLSTSQLVGYVAITADDNPDIEDTSDRERLASGLAVTEFQEILKTVVALIENERDIDRSSPERSKPLDDLFGQLTGESLLSEVKELAEDGADASEAVPLVQAYSAKIEVARKNIQERFEYYSRMATVGTIAHMLVHEIRNRTTVFGSFLKFIKDRFGPFKGDDLAKEYRFADEAVNSLERLAETFLPLASRSFRRRRRDSVLEDRIRACLNLQKGDIARKGIDCHVPKSQTPVAVDPGELDAILLNLIMNAVYWLGQVQEDKRIIEFKVARIGNGSRVRAWVHDNGPGVPEEDREKVFWPGFTRKPGGIGMGLTVASELVAEYGGRMLIDSSGSLGGASFGFDIPTKGA